MKKYIYVLFFILFTGSILTAQNLSNFEVVAPQETGKSAVNSNIRFNGYTKHWHDYYRNWHRYGNLFKIAVPDIPLTILQSKVDVAADIGLPGLLMQEGFINQLFSVQYKTIDNPSAEKLEESIGKGNVLVITSPSTDLGKKLEKKTEVVFDWTRKYANASLESRERLLNPFMYITGGPWIYWARALSLSFLSSNMQQVIPAVEGSMFMEKWAYLVYEPGNETPYAPVLEWKERLTNPLRIQLVEEVDPRVSETLIEIFIDEGKSGWEERETGRNH